MCTRYQRTVCNIFCVLGRSSITGKDFAMESSGYNGHFQIGWNFGTRITALIDIISIADCRRTNCIIRFAVGLFLQTSQGKDIHVEEEDGGRQERKSTEVHLSFFQRKRWSDRKGIRSLMEKMDHIVRPFKRQFGWSKKNRFCTTKTTKRHRELCE